MNFSDINIDYAAIERRAHVMRAQYVRSLFAKLFSKNAKPTHAADLAGSATA
ncbi:RSP_7527 family protein [Loktanella salsilacus]|uniref:RSP_7527 family protein n=1 Tax=Loktanella salsilacus TaxID=195913 RepID=UPI00373646B7